MPTLQRRVQILLDEGRYRRLAQQAARTGASVGELVRRAIDEVYPDEPSRPELAAQELLAAEPMEVGDWDEMKRSMLDDLYGGGEPR
jgi:hypothetical protein